MTLWRPPQIPYLSDFLFGHWPDGDEDAMRRAATHWSDMANALKELQKPADQSMVDALDAIDGKAHQAMASYWADISGGDGSDLQRLINTCESFAEQLEHGATDIEHTKLTIYISAMVMVAMTAWSWVPGAGQVGEVAAAAAVKVTIRAAVEKLLTEITTKGAAFVARRLAMRVGAKVATQAVIGAGIGAGTDAAAQGIQLAAGHRQDGFDLAGFFRATGAGAVAGGVAGPMSEGIGGNLAGRLAGGAEPGLVAGLVGKNVAEVPANVVGNAAAQLATNPDHSIDSSTLLEGAGGGLASKPGPHNTPHGDATTGPHADSPPEKPAAGGSEHSASADPPPRPSPSEVGTPSAADGTHPSGTHPDPGAMQADAPPSAHQGNGTDHAATVAAGHETSVAAQPDSNGASQAGDAKPPTEARSNAGPQTPEPGSTNQPAPAQAATPSPDRSAPPSQPQAPNAAPGDRQMPAARPAPDVAARPDAQTPAPDRNAPQRVPESSRPPITDAPVHRTTEPPTAGATPRPEATPTRPGHSDAPPRPDAAVRPVPDSSHRPPVGTERPSGTPGRPDNPHTPPRSAHPSGARNPKDLQHTGDPAHRNDASAPHEPGRPADSRFPEPGSAHPDSPRGDRVPGDAPRQDVSNGNRRLDQPAGRPEGVDTPTGARADGAQQAQAVPVGVPTPARDRGSDHHTAAHEEPGRPTDHRHSSDGDNAGLEQSQSGGAIRPRNPLDVAAQDKWAGEAYDTIRSSRSDVHDMVENLAQVPREDGSVGFTEHEIGQVKQHLFEEEHKLSVFDDNGNVVGHENRRFDADPDIAEAWMRLSRGEPLPADIKLLEHELAESNYLREHPDASYREAHAHANTKADWESDIPERTGENYQNWGEKDGPVRDLPEDGGNRDRSDLPVREQRDGAEPRAGDREDRPGRQSGGRNERPAGDESSRTHSGAEGQRPELAGRGRDSGLSDRSTEPAPPGRVSDSPSVAGHPEGERQRHPPSAEDARGRGGAHNPWEPGRGPLDLTVGEEQLVARYAEKKGMTFEEVVRGIHDGSLKIGQYEVYKRQAERPVLQTPDELTAEYLTEAIVHKLQNPLALRRYANLEPDVFRPGCPDDELPKHLTRSMPDGALDSAVDRVDVSRMFVSTRDDGLRPMWRDLAAGDEYLDAKNALFRMDSRGPEIFGPGFSSRDPSNLNIGSHVGHTGGGQADGFVSLSESPERTVARERHIAADDLDRLADLGQLERLPDGTFRQMRYMHELYHPGGIDVDATFHDATAVSPLHAGGHTEAEILAPGGISGDAIFRVWPREIIVDASGDPVSVKVGEPIYNPRFAHLENPRFAASHELSGRERLASQHNPTEPVRARDRPSEPWLSSRAPESDSPIPPHEPRRDAPTPRQEPHSVGPNPDRAPLSNRPPEHFRAPHTGESATRAPLHEGPGPHQPVHAPRQPDPRTPAPLPDNRAPESNPPDHDYGRGSSPTPPWVNSTPPRPVEHPRPAPGPVHPHAEARSPMQLRPDMHGSTDHAHPNPTPPHHPMDRPPTRSVPNHEPRRSAPRSNEGASNHAPPHDPRQRSAPAPRESSTSPHGPRSEGAHPQQRPPSPEVQRAQQARREREFYRNQRPEGDRVTPVRPDRDSPRPAFDVRRYPNAPGGPVTVVRLRVNVTHDGHISPHDVQRLWENAQFATDRAFNTGWRLLSGDRVLVDLVHTADPNVANIHMHVSDSPGSWHPGTPPEAIARQLHQQLGLSPESHLGLGPGSVREMSNAIAHSNTDSAVESPAQHRNYGRFRLQGVEHPEYQAAVEDALRHGDRFVAGADPRTNAYGRLINDGGIEVQGRSNNCLDCSLSALASFQGRPEVAAPRWPDSRPDGTLDNESGEVGGLERAAEWIGDGLHQLNDGRSVPAQFAGLHEIVRNMGPGSSALVINEWHARDPATGQLLYNADGSPRPGGSHATVIVYPRDASGPVWWDPQSGAMSEYPPGHMTGRSTRLWFTPIPPPGGEVHGGIPHPGASGAVSGANLQPRPQISPVRTGQGLAGPVDPHPGGDRLGTGLGNDEPGDRRGQRSGVPVSELEHGHDRGRVPGGEAGGRTPEGPADLSASMAAEHQAHPGGSEHDPVRRPDPVPDRSPAGERRVPTDDRQDHLPVPAAGADGGQRHSVGGDAEQSGRDLAERGDLGDLGENDGQAPSADPRAGDHETPHAGDGMTEQAPRLPEGPRLEELFGADGDYTPRADEFRAATVEDLGMGDLADLPIEERTRIQQALQVTAMVPPEQVRFTQRSVSRATSDGLSIPDLADAMAAGGWRGGPVHAVTWADGRIASLDNRRVTAARMAGLDHVPTALHAPTDRLADWPHEWDSDRRARNALGVDIRELPDGRLRVGGDEGVVRYRRGQVAETWGEIALFRAAEQRSLLPGELGGSDEAPVYAAKPARAVDVELSADEVNEIATAVRDAQPTADRVLDDLQGILTEVTDSLGLRSDPPEMRGEDHRVKSPESLGRKYFTERMPEESVTGFLDRVNDVVRFSVRLPEERYLESFEATIERLKEHGYEMVDIKNFWREGNRYYGMNTTVRTPEGRLFELQFPTDASWRANKLTHEYYEVFRRLDEPIERRVHALLNTLQINSNLGLGQNLPARQDGTPSPVDTGFAKWLRKNPDEWQTYLIWLNENGRSLTWVVDQFGLDVRALTGDAFYPGKE
ncbi:toxin glutamine deamidase domain-containing protein [Nocardia aobensis]|uniref:toxin glutamine deamidase domain-containing protein n=1 Tax=Nocardia aobensis TaxID=257277 RepID=UPI0012F679F4|nr:toxin glutamine deamidase domain-containing protein [Nocardia aobensis]